MVGIIVGGNGHKVRFIGSYDKNVSVNSIRQTYHKELSTACGYANNTCCRYLFCQGQWAIRAPFREVSLYLELSDRSEIWQAPRQYCRRNAGQISKRWNDLNYQSRSFKSSRDPTIKRLIGYWNWFLFIMMASYHSYTSCIHYWPFLWDKVLPVTQMQI